MTACSTVSGMLVHVVHIGVSEQLRLCSDWLRRARLKRRRETADDMLGCKVCRYVGMGEFEYVGVLI